MGGVLESQEYSLTPKYTANEYSSEWMFITILEDIDELK